MSETREEWKLAVEEHVRSYLLDISRQLSLWIGIPSAIGLIALFVGAFTNIYGLASNAATRRATEIINSNSEFSKLAHEHTINTLKVAYEHALVTQDTISEIETTLKNLDPATQLTELDNIKEDLKKLTKQKAQLTKQETLLTELIERTTSQLTLLEENETQKKLTELLKPLNDKDKKYLRLAANSEEILNIISKIKLTESGDLVVVAPVLFNGGKVTFNSLNPNEKTEISGPTITCIKIKGTTLSIGKNIAVGGGKGVRLSQDGILVGSGGLNDKDVYKKLTFSAPSTK